MALTMVTAVNISSPRALSACMRNNMAPLMWLSTAIFLYGAKAGAIPANHVPTAAGPHVHPSQGAPAPSPSTDVSFEQGDFTGAGNVLLAETTTVWPGGALGAPDAPVGRSAPP